MPIKLALFFVTASACFGQTSLTQYLNLSPAQVTAITRLTADFGNYASLQNTQQFLFDSQTSDLLKSASPDPAALGKIVADKEYSRRDAIAKQADVQKSVSAQLTSSQSALVQGLIQAAELLPLAQDASCAYLVQPLTNQTFTSILIPGLTGVLYDPGSSLPIISAAPTATFCYSAVFPVSVRNYLSLSDAQIATIAQASAAYNDFQARSSNRVADLNAQIQATLAAGNADALTLGLFYVEKDKINADVKSRDGSLRAAAQGQLTPQQQIKLKPLQDAANWNNADVIANALNCNFFLLPVGSAAFGTALTGSFAFCRL